jgi:LysR family glycine cleavage system transcriptional activator
LLQPFAQVGRDKNNYWLVYPESSRNFPKIRAFRDWLLEATAFLRAEESGGVSASEG